MKPKTDALQESIVRQRDALMDALREPMSQIAAAASRLWPDRAKLDGVLAQLRPTLPQCKFLYALDANAIQISDNVSVDGLKTKDFGRDRSQRPYMLELQPGADFLLSQAYLSARAKRPSLTAIQVVRDDAGAQLGYVGADFDLRDLPLTRELYEEPRYWRQIKGDPSIRETVFHQNRIESEMDRQIELVLGVTEELMVEHGVFHVRLHFSSSRATIWVIDDPYRFRLLDIDALVDPDICLAYPQRPYPDDALVPANEIRTILHAFRELRFMDEMLYLRSGAINIFNGIVGLTFSCDGTHYIPYAEFEKTDLDFWTGGAIPQ